MIFTLTLNPSLDYYMGFENINIGEVNRSTGEEMFFGGKGINVSRMLNKLGAKSYAITLVGGFTGRALIEGLRNEGILTEPVTANGNTRINIKISNSGTELNGKGVLADENTLTELKAILCYPKKGDYIVMSGSLCGGVNDNVYADICERLNSEGVYTVVDTYGNALIKALDSKPWLVKPNHLELGDIFNVKINTVDDAIVCSKKLLETGVQNVLVSLGKDGAVFVSPEEEIFCPAPVIEPISTVGSGDCLLAGFLHSKVEGKSNKEALLYAVACGSAKAMHICFPNMDDIKAIFDKISLKKV